MRQAYGTYQNEIYFGGLGGIMPDFPMTFAEWEAKAQAVLPPSLWSYVAGGAATSALSEPMSRPSSGGDSCRACSSAPASAISRSNCSE